jgi:hypothetical protein
MNPFGLLVVDLLVLLLTFGFGFDFGHEPEMERGTPGGLARHLPEEVAGNPPGGPRRT